MTAAIALGLYAVIVVGVLVGNMRWSRYQAARTVRISGAYPACIPVHPPITQADVDAAWVDAWPQHRMPQQQVDRLFGDLIAIEGLQ